MWKIVLIIIAVLVIGLIIAIEHHANGRIQRFSMPQRRRITFGAVLGTVNQMDETKMCRMPGGTEKNIRELIKDSWNVTDHDKAITALTWLRTGGSHVSAYEKRGGELYQTVTGYDEIYEAFIGKQEQIYTDKETLEMQYAGIKATREALINEFGYSEKELDSIGTISSWDYNRMSWLARACYGAGYISPEEAWTYIDAAADMGEREYRDWRGYFAGYLLGHAMWGGHPESPKFPERNRDLAKKLLEDKNSPYYRFAFKGQ